MAKDVVNSFMFNGARNKGHLYENRFELNTEKSRKKIPSAEIVISSIARKSATLNSFQPTKKSYSDSEQQGELRKKPKKLFLQLHTDI
ncbi:hypothetical protein [Noviherbaspirillum agri]